MFNRKRRKGHISRHNIPSNHSPIIFLILKLKHNAWIINGYLFTLENSTCTTLPPSLPPLLWQTSESIRALGLAELRQDLRILRNTAFQVAPHNPSILAFMLKSVSSLLCILLNTLNQNIEMDLQRKPLLQFQDYSKTFI